MSTTVKESSVWLSLYFSVQRLAKFQLLVVFTARFGALLLGRFEPCAAHYCLNLDGSES